MMAGPAAVTSTFRLIDAPSSTRPVLMKNSVRKPLRQRVAQRQLGQHHVADQAQSDCVDREFDRLGHLGERRARRPLRHLGLQEAGGRAERDDDEHAGDRVARVRGSGCRAARASPACPSRDHAARYRADEHQDQQAKGRRSRRASPHSWDGTVSNPSAHVTGCDQREFNRYECANRLLTSRVSHAGENRAPVARTLLCEPTGKCT